MERDDEILACVAEFEKYGIRPVLWGASSIGRVASRVRDRIAGVITRSAPASVAAAGIPIAFYSAAEEGAVELASQAFQQIGNGLSTEAAMRALTSDAAKMLGIDHRVGTLRAGLDADILLLDGSPLDLSSRILRVWVDGEEIR